MRASDFCVAAHALPKCQVILDPAGPGCACLNPLLRSGVKVPVPGPMPVRALLCDVVGLNPEFVERRIATLFLNNHPVDDLDATLARPGDSLALAAAMPGIAGITMRRNSPVKALRADISCTPDADGNRPAAAGPITLKLFNFIALEAGPGLLAQGVIAPAGRLAETLRECARQVRSLTLDNQPATPDDLAKLAGDVHLVAIAE
jgi:phage tail protein X